MRRTLAGIPVALAIAVTAHAVPSLTNPEEGVLERLTPASEASKLDAIDGLAFDPYGNLLGVREVSGVGGGVVAIDTETGLVTELLAGVSRADQIALVSGGEFRVTSEVTPASPTSRLFALTLGYTDQVPDPGSTGIASVTTSLAIDNPEGLVILPADGAYGFAGDAYVCEDRNPGRVLRVRPDGTTSVLAAGLSRPEGAAFGDFGGTAAPALYVAETSTHRVIRIDADGTVATLGAPGAVALTSPDNVEFGPDGFLYVTEDRPAPSSRVIRIAADGTHEVFATGFGQAQGMIFAANGDFYVAEQDSDRVWRVRFGVATAAAPFPDPTRLPNLTGRPNPFAIATDLEFEIARTAAVRLSVHDVRGRRIAVLEDGPLGPGRHRRSWTGTGHAGEPVPPGVYYARLEVAGAVHTRKIVLRR
ncbi:MAG: hypothetical protein R3B81_13375 [bacterium]